MPKYFFTLVSSFWGKMCLQKEWCWILAKRDTLTQSFQQFWQRNKVFFVRKTYKTTGTLRGSPLDPAMKIIVLIHACFRNISNIFANHVMPVLVNNLNITICKGSYVLLHGEQCSFFLYHSILTKHSLPLWIQSVFRIQSNIWDEAFYQIKKWLKAVNYFWRKFHIE